MVPLGICVLMIPVGHTWNIEWNYKTSTRAEASIWIQTNAHFLFLFLCTFPTQTKQRRPIENEAFKILSDVKSERFHHCYRQKADITTNHEREGKWKTQLIFNLIKFNYCDVCFLLLRQSPSTEKLMTWTQLFPFVSTKEKGTREGKCNYIFRF